MAVISLGVVNVEKTAGDAMAKVNADAAALIAVLSEQGIEARDIQTSQLSVNPVWSSYDSNDRKITGFEARNAVTLRVRELDGLGGVLDQVLEVGANTFNGLQFQLQDPSAAEAEARAAAVRDAMEKAAQLSEAAGVGLGPVLSLSEGRAKRTAAGDVCSCSVCRCANCGGRVGCHVARIDALFARAVIQRPRCARRQFFGGLCPRPLAAPGIFLEQRRGAACRAGAPS